MPIAISSDEMDRLLDLSPDELNEHLGDTLIKGAVECLNESLAAHDGASLIMDDQAHDMDQYIDAGKLKDVLTDARKLAETRGITVEQTVDIESVHTDNDAIRFVFGSGA